MSLIVRQSSTRAGGSRRSGPWSKTCFGTDFHPAAGPGSSSAVSSHCSARSWTFSANEPESAWRLTASSATHRPERGGRCKRVLTSAGTVLVRFANEPIIHRRDEALHVIRGAPQVRCPDGPVSVEARAGCPSPLGEGQARHREDLGDEGELARQWVAIDHLSVAIQPIWLATHRRQVHQAAGQSG
jgi:hypothetical protein